MEDTENLLEVIREKYNKHSPQNKQLTANVILVNLAGQDFTRTRSY